MPFRVRGALLLITFLDAAAIGLVIPAYPSLLLELGAGSFADAARVGIALLLIHAVLQSIAAPLIGRLSDRHGRSAWLLVSIAATSADYLLGAMGTTVGALMVGKLIVGTCSHTTAMVTATIADQTAEAERARWFGYRNAAWGLGITVAPLVGGWLAMRNARAPFVAAATVAGLAAIVWLRMRENAAISIAPTARSNRSRRGARLPWQGRSGFVALLGGWALWQLASHAIPSSWSYFTMHRFAWTAQEVGLSLSVFGALYALVQSTLVSPIVRRFGTRQTVIVGLALYVFAFLGYAFAPTSAALMAFAIPLAAASITIPTLRSALSNAIGAEAQGTLSGAIAALRAVTAIAAPPLMMGSFSAFATVELEYDLAGAPFLIAAVASFGALLFARRAFLVAGSGATPETRR